MMEGLVRSEMDIKIGNRGNAVTLGHCLASREEERERSRSQQIQAVIELVISIDEHGQFCLSQHVPNKEAKQPRQNRNPKKKTKTKFGFK